MAMELDTISDLLSSLREEAPEELQHIILSIEDQYERKLYHELTGSLMEYFSQAPPAQKLELFQNFISKFDTKINQLQLVRLGLSAAAASKTDQERLAFTQSLAAKVNKPASQDAFVYATVAVSSIELQIGALPDARKNLDACEAILDTFDAVETAVHAAFYSVNAEYYKAKQAFAAYYKSALLYLACVDVATDMSADERASRAHDLSITALVSDTIYNFGELLLHPILDSLVDGQHAWLRDLLFAFNRGELVTANAILERNMHKNSMLRDHRAFLYTKMSLAALTETVFRRPPQNRTMTFAAIGKETNVPAKEIEHLVMKALSLGLLRGTIDQVAEVARINWVQPKVLDKGQIEGMKVRLREWDASVNNLGNWIEGVGKDVWAA